MHVIDINKLLQGVNCECGKTHTCNIEKVYVEKNAIARLTERCVNFNEILLVADENTFLQYLKSFYLLVVNLYQALLL